MNKKKGEWDLNLPQEHKKKILSKYHETESPLFQEMLKILHVNKKIIDLIDDCKFIIELNDCLLFPGISRTGFIRTWTTTMSESQYCDPEV